LILFFCIVFTSVFRTPVTEPRRRSPARSPRLSLRRQSISGAEASRQRTVARPRRPACLPQLTLRRRLSAATEARRASSQRILSANDRAPARRPARPSALTANFSARRHRRPSQAGAAYAGDRARPRRPAQPGALATAFSAPAIDLRRGGPPGPARSQRSARRIGLAHCRPGRDNNHQARLHPGCLR
jgi:hypothetical protein